MWFDCAPGDCQVCLDCMNCLDCMLTCFICMAAQQQRSVRYIDCARTGCGCFELVEHVFSVRNLWVWSQVELWSMQILGLMAAAGNPNIQAAPTKCRYSRPSIKRWGGNWVGTSVQPVCWRPCKLDSASPTGTLHCESSGQATLHTCHVAMNKAPKFAMCM